MLHPFRKSKSPSIKKAILFKYFIPVGVYLMVNFLYSIEQKIFRCTSMPIIQSLFKNIKNSGSTAQFRQTHIL